ncbi:MAG: hypothetical protein GY842_28260 [bacterium]|nr:hypothetical protein [bacterium]
MMRNTLFACALICLGWVVTGCVPPAPTPGGNTNGNVNDNFNNSEDISLGADGQFDIADGGDVAHAVAVELSSGLGLNTLTELAVAINRSEVSIDVTDADTSAEQVTTLDVLIAAEDACSSGASLGQFEIAIDANTAGAITPARLEADAGALVAAGDGDFELCLRAASQIDQTLIVSRISVLYSAALPQMSCSEILAQAGVQTAITTLAGQGFALALHEGDQPRDVEGTYLVRGTIDFDPDGTDSGALTERVDVLSGQTAERITRTTGTASLEQSISGDSTNVNLCVSARSHNATCDQTIARMEAYDASNPSLLEGEFLAVVLERHTSGSESCGAAGDFIYGSIELVRQSTSFDVQPIGKVVLADDFTPELVILPDDRTRGAVTDRHSDAALEFELSGAFATSALPIPGRLDANGYNGIGMARDNSLLALISDSPDEVLIFRRQPTSLVLEAGEQDRDLGVERVDFSPEADFVYVISPDPFGQGDEVRQYHTIPTGVDSLAARYPTPNARTPELARLNPQGDQLAVLLNGEAGEGKSQWLTLLDLETGEYSTPIDLREATEGFVSDRYLVYSRDGARLFMAGDRGVVVAEAAVSPVPTPINVDVSRGEEDAALSIDLSNDGDVLVVAVDKFRGDYNFAIIEVSSLTPIHHAHLERISNRSSIGVAHFETGRACIVANDRERVVAVQTVDPYEVSAQLSAADNELETILGRVVAGGNLIAVTNVSEPAIYLYELAD